MTRVAALRTGAAFAAFGAALVAFAMPGVYLRSAPAALAAAGGLAVLLFPMTALGLVTVMVAFCPEEYLAFERAVDAALPGLGAATAQKVLLLAALAAAAIKFGVRELDNPGVFGVVAILVLAAAFGSAYPGLTPLQGFRSLVALALPFVFFSIRYDDRAIDRLLLAIALMPAISIAFGIVAELGAFVRSNGFTHTVFQTEYTGAVRLRGAAIPAYLGLLGYASIFVCLYQGVVRGHRAYYLIGAFSFLCVALSGTRMPLGMSAAMAATVLIFSSQRVIDTRTRGGLIAAGAAVGAAVLAMSWDTLIARTFQDTGALNTSGRDAIWHTMWAGIEVNPWFGRGLGTGSIILLDADDWRFRTRAAHNEYLRLLADGGWVGLGVFIAGMAALMGRALKPMDRDTRLTALAMLGTFAVYSYTDNTLTAPPALCLFLALALMAQRARSERGLP